MAKSQKVEGMEIVSGGKPGKNGKKPDRQPGITPIDFWEQGFDSLPYSNDIDKILEIPDIEDMAGVLSRGNFKNDKQRVAAVRLAYKNRKFKDDNHQKMLRDFVASGIGMSGFGKLLQLQIGTNLALPGVLQQILGLRKTKGNEPVYKGSDFRDEGREREVRND